MTSSPLGEGLGSVSQGITFPILYVSTKPLSAPNCRHSALSSSGSAARGYSCPRGLVVCGATRFSYFYSFHIPANSVVEVVKAIHVSRCLEGIDGNLWNKAAEGIKFLRPHLVI